MEHPKDLLKASVIDECERARAGGQPQIKEYAKTLGTVSRSMREVRNGPLVLRTFSIADLDMVTEVGGRVIVADTVEDKFLVPREDVCQCVLRHNLEHKLTSCRRIYTLRDHHHQPQQQDVRSEHRSRPSSIWTLLSLRDALATEAIISTE